MGWILALWLALAALGAWFDSLALAYVGLTGAAILAAWLFFYTLAKGVTFPK
jgi:hypothetical protein